MQINFKLLSEAATPPKRGSEHAAGYDLYSAVNDVVPARGSKVIPTDIALEMHEGMYGQVFSRSGLASKHSMFTSAGVIDPDYRGNIGVILFNHSDNDFTVKVGDRIGQIIFFNYLSPILVPQEELSATVRGANGYGSTGIN